MATAYKVRIFLSPRGKLKGYAIPVGVRQQLKPWDICRHYVVADDHKQAEADALIEHAMVDVDWF